MASTTLYRFFDKDGALLYVGISHTAIQRWAQHRADKPWWHEVARAEVEHFGSRSTAHQAEVRAIRTEQPRHNIQGNYSDAFMAAMRLEPCIGAVVRQIRGDSRARLPDWEDTIFNYADYTQTINILVGWNRQPHKLGDKECPFNDEIWLASSECYDVVTRRFDLYWQKAREAGLAA